MSTNQVPRVPTQNNQQFTLDSQISAGASSLTLNQSVAGIVQAPGYLVVDRVDANGNKTASKREYKYFTGVSSAQLTGLTNVDGTDQVHAVGAIVEFVPDIKYEADWYSAFITEHSIYGQHASLPSLSFIQTGRLVGVSQASIALLNVGTLFSASGASVQGVFPSGGSGAILTSNGNTLAPVYAPQSAGQATIIAPNSIVANDGGVNLTTSGTTELTVISKTITNPSAAGQILLMAQFSMVPTTTDADFFLLRVYGPGGAITSATQRVTGTADRQVVTLVGIAAVANSGSQVIKMTIVRDTGSGTVTLENARSALSWVIFPGASTTA